MADWTKYFKFVKLRRGRVVTQRFGLIDFSRDDLPIAKLKTLYEADFPYLEITREGERVLYGIKNTSVDPDPPKKPAKKPPSKKTGNTKKKPLI